MEHIDAVHWQRLKSGMLNLEQDYAARIQACCCLAAIIGLLYCYCWLTFSWMAMCCDVAVIAFFIILQKKFAVTTVSNRMNELTDDESKVVVLEAIRAKYSGSVPFGCIESGLIFMIDGIGAVVSEELVMMSENGQPSPG